MVTIPNSWGSDLREFNPCHQSADGKFAVKGQGRCLGDAARRAARVDHSKALHAERVRDFTQTSDTADADHARDFPDSAFSNPASQKEYRAHNWAQAQWARLEDLRQKAGLRKSAKKFPVPAFLAKDAARAWKTDRTVTIYDKTEIQHGSPGTSYGDNRTVAISPSGKDRAYHSKVAQLSVFRHELGHQDQTPLGRTRILGRQHSETYTEEVRAWKNAIRNSGGKVDFKTLRAGLASYLSTEYPHAPKQAARVADQHVALLQRYARKIRRASKGL